MRPELVSAEQIRERVLELVASVEFYARMGRKALEQARDSGADINFALDVASVQVSLATELATLLGKGRLEVEGGGR